MAIMMPASDQAVLARRAEIIAALRAIVPGEGVIDTPAEMRAYESDGLTAYRQPPMVVVLPDTTEQVSLILKYCAGQNIKVVPRGSGTSLSGGALPLEDGVLLGLGKFKRIREIDFDNRVVVTEPGVTNLAISQAVAHAGFYYAPDPSSQIACSIGGNVAENSGGVHCLKYGMTTNNVLGCEIVLISGEILRIGGKSAENPGYDLMGVITGSEGLLGVITEITVRILQKPETARALMVGFAEVEAAGECVARIIGAGIIPGGMEMMDRPAIHAAEAFVHAGYPLDVEALLIIEPRRPQDRGGRADHARRDHRKRLRFGHAANLQLGSRAQPVLGRPQGRVPGRRPDLAGLSLHGRHHPARRAAEGAGAHPRGSAKNTSSAAPTCSTLATATCIR